GWIPVELALPRGVAEDDHVGNRVLRLLLAEGAAEQRLKAEHTEVAAAHDHALERLAADIVDQERERPRVAGQRFEGLGFGGPLRPLRGRPAARCGDAAVDTGGGNQDQLLWIAIR